MQDIAAALESRLKEALLLTDQLRNGSNSPIIGDTSLAPRKRNSSREQYAAGDPLANARILLAVRRERDKMFGGDLFGEPAWDMLLDLFIHQHQGKKLSVSGLCVASATPPTTALRHIVNLTEQGLLQRLTDPRDGRRVWVTLTPVAFESLTRLLTY